MGGPCSTHGKKISAYKMFVGNPESKRPLKGLSAERKFILKQILGK